jgi:hypothetical protein
MKIILTEDQLDKLVKAVKPKDGDKFIKCDSCRKLFTQTTKKGKKSLPICPWCGRHNMEMRVDDLKEIDRYKFSEPRLKGKPSPQDYEDVITSNTEIKTVGDFTYYYNDSEDNYVPIIKFFVLDKKNKEYVGNAEFEMRYGGDFFVTLPYIRSEYRGRGIASEIYKTLLSMGDIVSGKAQSDQAVGLWFKLYNELPNKMYYVDDDGKLFDVYSKDGELYTTKTNTSVYDVKGGYLRLTKNQ